MPQVHDGGGMIGGNGRTLALVATQTVAPLADGSGGSEVVTQAGTVEQAVAQASVAVKH